MCGDMGEGLSRGSLEVALTGVTGCRPRIVGAVGFGELVSPIAPAPSSLELEPPSPFSITFLACDQSRAIFSSRAAARSVK